MKQSIDNRPDTDKSDKIEIPVGSSKMRINIEPSTETVSECIATEEYWGGVIRAEVNSPKDAIDDLGKYEFEPFDNNYIDSRIRDYLARAKSYLQDSDAAREINDAFESFVAKRQQLLPYRSRLQDIPMLQVIHEHKKFESYLSAYEKLLSSIKLHFATLWNEDPVGARDIVNTIVSLDFLYVLGSENSHAVPTPLNPLYLWKYIKLAQEMLETGGLEEGQDCHLTEEDKAFIMRKAEDIPDPLTLVLIPNSIADSSECLPISGRIGCLPVYSTKPQISIASHSTNSIFDQNHGKGSLGLALAAIYYKRQHPASLLVGLDTQLAREWLSERDDGRLPDLIGLRFESQDTEPQVDIIEVKTHQDYMVSATTISGHAVEQTMVLDTLLREIFGHSEKITTVSRKEILREQVFECLFHSELPADEKFNQTQWLNQLFAGELLYKITKIICHVDFDQAETMVGCFSGVDVLQNESFQLLKLGSKDIQALLSDRAIMAGASTMLLGSRVETSNPNHSDIALCGNQAATDKTDDVSQDQSADSVFYTKLSEVAEVNLQETTILQKENPIDPEIVEKCIRLNLILKGYGIKANPVDEKLVQQAARFTRFKIELKPGETIKKLMDKSQDIARELEAYGEIFIDNIKGTRYVGMDVPLCGMNKPLMLMDNLYRLDDSKGTLDVLAGQAPDGRYEIVDLAKAPHMLIAGTTGSGKTVFLYSVLVSLLYKLSFSDLEFLIVDPKQTDFHFFDTLPNLRGGRVLTDAEEALAEIEKLNNEEKEIRTQMIRAANSRDIDSYNSKNPTNRMKRLIVVIDEYADLVQAAELQGKDVRKEFETHLCMLAQRVRNLGIHLVIATQQPRATIVTSSLKAVLPYRASFRLPSHVDSQTILDRAGAEDLLGKGDMLLMTDSDLIRMQGFFISEDQLIDFIDSKKNE